MNPLELLPLAVVAIVQLLELSARQFERLEKRVTLHLDIPEDFLSRGEAPFLTGPLLGELCFEPRPVFVRPPAERRRRGEKTAAHARGFSARLAQLTLDTGARVGLASKVVQHRLLAGAGGRPFGCGILLGTSQRELDGVQPGFERAPNRRAFGKQCPELRFALRQPICGGDRVCRALFLRLLERRGSVAQLAFERVARCCSLRQRVLDLLLEIIPVRCCGGE